MKPLVRAACLAALTLPGLANAQSAADIQALREEINALRTQYEARIKALEAKLEAAQAQPAAVAPQPAPAPAPLPAVAAAGPAPSSGNGFNPALSLILSGVYTRASRDPSTYRIA